MGIGDIDVLEQCLPSVQDGRTVNEPSDKNVCLRSLATGMSLASRNISVQNPTQTAQLLNGYMHQLAKSILVSGHQLADTIQLSLARAVIQ